jgi:hypothetical protein
MSETSEAPARSYGCSRACGNPYDFVIVTVSEAFTEMLCFPCMVQTAMDMVRAVVNPDDDAVKAAIAEFPASEQVPMVGGVTRKRGHHAPAESDDPDALDFFDGVITEDELPDAFR